MVEKKKRKLRDRKSLQLLVLEQDFETVRLWWVAGELSRSTLGNALKALDKVPAFEKVTAAFRLWLKEELGVEPARGRGRSLPAIGEKRSYKVQQVGDAPVFVRLTLTNLDVVKSDNVLVSFEDGRTVVTKA